MNLIEHIGQYVNFSPELIKELENTVHLENRTKGEILLKEGQYCREIYYVEKGCLRFFYHDDGGKDITHWFLFENEFITEIDSLFSQKPSTFYLEALENCVLQTITPQDLFVLGKKYPELIFFKDRMLLKAIVNLGEKIKDLQFRDAKTRYDNLIKKHPDILLRVPLGYVASYLGITQPSLSRIRRQR